MVDAGLSQAVPSVGAVEGHHWPLGITRLIPLTRHGVMRPCKRKFIGTKEFLKWEY